MRSEKEGRIVMRKRKRGEMGRREIPDKVTKGEQEEEKELMTDGEEKREDQMSA